MDEHYRRYMFGGKFGGISVGLIAGLVLAAVFAFAAAGKARHPQMATSAAAAMLAVRLPSAVGPILVVVEAVAAILLAVPTTRSTGAVVALVMLLVFSLGIAKSLHGGRRPTCSCFGAIGTNPISSIDLARNGALGVLAVLALAG